MILDPAYTRGEIPLGYTLLSDLDGDGAWDVREVVRVGPDPGDSKHTLQFKRGYGPARAPDREAEFNVSCEAMRAEY